MRVPALAAASLALVLAACGDKPTAPKPPPPPPPLSIAVFPEQVTLNSINQEAALSVRLENARAADSAGVRWQSLDTTVVAVSAQGRVTARATGTTRVVVSTGGVADTAAVEVRQVPAAIRLSPSGDTLFVGDTIRVQAVVADSGGTAVPGHPVRLEVAAGTSAALLDAAAGIVAAVGPGQTTIRATSGTAGLGANLPITVAGPFVRISAGVLSTCALTAAGEAYCWGSNQWGQLGLPASVRSSVRPVAIRGTAPFAQVAASEGMACALSTAGEVFCWGTVNGTAVGTDPVRVSGATPFRQIAANRERVCGITLTDDLLCWDPTKTPGPQQPPVRSGVASVFGNGGFVCVIGSARTVDCLDGSSPPVSVAPGFAFGSAHADYRCGQSATGAAYCWSRFSAPVQLGGAFTPGTVSQTYLHGCILAADGRARCWGGNNYGALGNGTIGFTWSEPVASTPVAGGLSFSAISTGGFGYDAAHSCAISGGVLYCWGTNQWGQLGNAYATSTCTPPPGNGSPLPCSPRPVRVSRVRPGVTGR